MCVIIDAWLERRDPWIRLIDTETGQEILRLGVEDIHELMDSGDLCMSDLEEASSPCVELFALMEERSVVRWDPTRLQLSSYMRRLKTEPQRALNQRLP